MENDCKRKKSEEALSEIYGFYDERMYLWLAGLWDGSTGGFFADNVQAGQQVWNTVNLLLRLDRNWKV